MATLQEIRETLREATLAACRDEYGEHTATWRSLETKAQGNIAVAGIFIAGSLAYLTKTDLKLERHEEVFLLVAVCCLVISVILSILALRAQEVTLPPLGSFVDYFTAALLPMDDEAELQTYLGTFFEDHAKLWRTVISEVKESNTIKAQFLWRAQQFLITAIFAVAALSLSKLV